MARFLRTSTANFVRERVVRPLLPDAVSSALNRNDRTGALCRAWGHVFTNQLCGGYYEFGVYRGDTFRRAWEVYQVFDSWQQGQLDAPEPWRRKAAEPYANFRHGFYAFDTFSGMPMNDEGNTTFSEGVFATSVETFDRLNRAAKLPAAPRAQRFVGTFGEILRTQRPVLEALQPAAIVNIDCDLYASAREALECIAPKLQQGSVVLFDDWNAFAARRDAGERRAAREFLAQQLWLAFEPWFAYEYTGQAFLVHMNGQPHDR